MENHWRASSPHISQRHVHGQGQRRDGLRRREQKRLPSYQSRSQPCATRALTPGSWQGCPSPCRGSTPAQAHQPSTSHQQPKETLTHLLANLDRVPAPAREQDAVAGLHLRRHNLAVLRRRAGADGDDGRLRERRGRRGGGDEDAGGGFLGVGLVGIGEGREWKGRGRGRASNSMR